MKLLNILNRVMALTIAGILLSGCSGLIYQNEGDCDPHYKVKFVYDWNMAFADAFPRQVSAVTLYLVDPQTGKIVWQKHESGEALAREGYLMDVDIAPGTYTMLAWAGEGHKTHFSVADAEHHTDLHCRLLTKTHPTDGSAIHNELLDPLFHGKVELQEFTDRQGTHVYTVPLIKDTNNIQVVLQHLSGAPVDASELTFTITDNNAHMSWDNSLVNDSPVTYYHWDRRQAAGTIISPETGILQSHSAAKAELSVARLVKRDKPSDGPVLTVTRPDGTEVFHINLLEWCLAFKSQYYNRSAGRAPMSDQEFLDRRDDWPFTFFLDEGYRWVSSYIYIESFKVVNQSVDL